MNASRRTSSIEFRLSEVRREAALAESVVDFLSFSDSERQTALKDVQPARLGACSSVAR